MPDAKQQKGSGSPTNPSDAVDDVELDSHPTAEQMIDAGVMQTFPASDPLAVESAGETEHERRKRGAPKQDPKEAGQRERRSPDWMLKPPR
jgi:hypothetical protein